MATIHPEKGRDKTEEFEDDSDSDDSSVDSKYAKADESKIQKAKSTSVKVAKLNPNSYSRKRDVLKERIIREVLDLALPDMGEFDMTDVIMGPKKPWGGRAVEWAKLCGCWPVTPHEAVLYGSSGFLASSIARIKKKQQFELLNQLDQLGRTPLIVSIIIERSDLADIILNDSPADPNICDTANGNTPLHYSLLMKNLVTAKILIKKGAAINMGNYKCVTPLMIACATSNLDAAKYLIIQCGADIDAVDDNGWSALHYAAYSGEKNICKLLIIEGASRDLKDNRKRKPIHIARFKEHGNCVAVLEDVKSKIAFATGDDF